MDFKKKRIFMKEDNNREVLCDIYKIEKNYPLNFYDKPTKEDPPPTPPNPKYTNTIHG